MWVGQWEQRFSDTQMKSLLEGKKTLVRGLKGKKGSYDAYLIPEGIEDYSYNQRRKGNQRFAVQIQEWNFHREKASEKETEK